MVRLSQNMISETVILGASSYLRLDNAGADDGMSSSSASRERLRGVLLVIPRFAEDIFGRNGEL